MTVDRKTSDQKIRVAKAVVSLIGGIQPGVLQRAIGREHLQDGLCARLLLVMPESKPVCWSEEVIPTSTVTEFEAMVAKLLELPGTQDPRGHETPIALALSPGAKALWVDYYNRHRSEMDQLEEDLRAAASKLEAYTARFALIFQLASWAADEPYAGAELIDEVAMLDAIALSDWFLGEAKRVYALFGENDDERHDRELVEFIQRRGGRITARELQSSSRRYRKSGAAEAALDGLVKAAYGQWEVVPTGRRPRYEFILSALSAPTLFNDSADLGNNADSTGAENGWADQLPF